MFKSIFSGFWKKISKLILNNRILIIFSLGLATYFFSTNWDNIRFTYTEANLLTETHPENIKYKKFTDKFGEEGNLIVISVKDSTLFTIEKLNAHAPCSLCLSAHNKEGMTATNETAKSHRSRALVSKKMKKTPQKTEDGGGEGRGR